MRALLSCCPLLLALSPGCAAPHGPTHSIAPEMVVVPSGTLRLKALLWMPAGPGPFPGVLFSHGRSDDAEHTGGLKFAAAAERLGPVFARHGYAFLFVFRRGEGLSANQGSFIGDVLQREAATSGEAARKHLQFVLLTTDHLDDVLAGISFLKSHPRVDAGHIAVAGHSFGGQLTLLAAERDSSLRAAITFGAAAGSWEGSTELQERLLTAIRKMTIPVMFIHAANDYSVVPGQVMADQLTQLGKPCVLKIYPPVGKTPDEGHNAMYMAVNEWETDVFAFLDQYLKS